MKYRSNKYPFEPEDLDRYLLEQDMRGKEDRERRAEEAFNKVEQHINQLLNSLQHGRPNQQTDRNLP